MGWVEWSALYVHVGDLVGKWRFFIVLFNCWKKKNICVCTMHITFEAADIMCRFFFIILPFILLCAVFYFCYSSAASSSLVCRHSAAAGRGSGISNRHTIRYAICVCVLCLLCGFPPFKIHRIDRTDGRFHKMTRFAGIVHMVFIWFSAATQIKHKTKKYTPTRMRCKCITETMRNIPNTSCSEFEEYFICSHNVSVWQICYNNIFSPNSVTGFSFFPVDPV